ncbi:uncharacterized protein LOC142587383 isoform X2 [Dermacentor variabilis]|uniref:uncharacterized protein LOC142587383 isoform X2 n=1 Tax=Dermacentor variabilis TaxID=34621 RepID=UPI003F5BFC3E
MLILKAALLVHVVVAIADSQDEFPEYSDQYEAYSYGNALEVLKASEPVYLFRASSDWNTGFTRCMRSELSRYAGDTTYERTLKYQAQTESGSGKWVEYETKMQLTFKLGTTTQSYIQVKELGSPSPLKKKGVLFDVYPVLFAQPNCVVMGTYNSTVHGRLIRRTWLYGIAVLQCLTWLL